MRKILAGLGMVSVLGCITLTLAEEAPKVTVFSPEGSVRSVRQVRAQFSESMIAFGDLRAGQKADGQSGNRQSDPFNIQCAEKGTSRWVDDKNWVFDFERDLPSGVRCSYTLRDDLKSLSGKPLSGKKTFSFITGGPSIGSPRPYEGSQISEDQGFVLVLEGPVDEKSVLENAYFSVDGVASRIPVRLIKGKDREAILKTQYLANDPKIVIAQGRERFAPSSKVTLVWGKGITSPNGIATESDQVFHYKVRDPFKAEMNCERENATAPCIPFLPVRLLLSDSTLKSELAKARIRDGAGHEWKPAEPKRSFYDEEYEGGSEKTANSIEFKGPFPENAELKLFLPKGIKDESDRSLSNADRFPLSFSTGGYPPLAKFSATFGIIEASDPVLPVTLRNLEPEVKARLGFESTQSLRIGKVDPKAVLEWMAETNRRNWNHETRDQSIFGKGKTPDLMIRDLAVPKPNGAKAFEVVGIPLEKPGFYVVELRSEILGKSLLGDAAPMYVSTAALVTRMGVHFKKGRESSLAWVTSLENGQPVDGATVSVRDCSGAVLVTGKTDSQGVARFKEIAQAKSCNESSRYSEYYSGYFVTAEKGDDFSFAHSTWKKGIEPWRFKLPARRHSKSWIASTVFDRTLFRAGETVHMRHFLRRHTMDGFSLLPKGERPTRIRIAHEESGDEFEMPLSESDESTWSIPKTAKLGRYSVTLYRDRNDYKTRYPSGSFRVEEFRVPLMKGKIQPPKEALISPDAIDVDLGVEYQSGGGARGQAVVLRWKQSEGQGKSDPDFEGYVFANGPVSAVDSSGTGQDDEEARTKARPEESLHRRELSLDSAGTARVRIDSLKRFDSPSRVEVELEFRDSNGETQTVSRGIETYPSESLIAIESALPYGSSKNVELRGAVINPAGEALKGAPYEIEAFRREVYSHRKRLVGGFYAYDNEIRMVKLGKVCSGTTDEKARYHCTTTVKDGGNYYFQARTKDAQGRSSYANTSVWVYAENPQWFEQENEDRIDVLADKKFYEPGETARLQVRMPFREAHALVTVEREGVIDARVVPISGSKPEIEVPILKNYAPNAYVSVFVVRGRTGTPQPTAMVDLGRPAYKLGIAPIRVGWKGSELKVQVRSDREVYQIREKAKVRVHVDAVDGSKLAPGSDIVVAAVDEGLLELKSNESWKLLDAMMAQRGYEVVTSTAQSQIVGKRHYGLKALPQGGDGGKTTTRELFDTLLFWNAKVSLDDRGDAEVEIPLNDSITAFRVVAVASSGTGKFGTGGTRIRSTQDLSILSGISPLAREGDRLNSEFSLRNSTAKPMRVEVSGEVKADAGSFSAKLDRMTVELAPGESKIQNWKLEVPFGIGSLRYEITALSSAGPKDRLAISQKIVPAVPVRTLQGTLDQIKGPYSLAVAQPVDALPGRGELAVTLDSSLIGGLEGVREYMKRYPFGCLEQISSKAVALMDRKEWARVMADLPTYLDSSGLANYFPGMRWSGSDVLTAYLLSLSNEAGSGWEIPSDSRSKMVFALQKFVLGQVPGGSEPASRELALRKVSAIAALSRTGDAGAELLSTVTLQPNLWPTSSVLDWYEILIRMPTYPDRAQKIAEAEQILRGRLTFQGTLFGFSTDSSDWMSQWMITPDWNANRLVSLALHPDVIDHWRSDLPRLARGTMGRQKRGHWDTTPANAWGVLAMHSFARVFETQKVSGTTVGELQTQKKEISWKGGAGAREMSFAWPNPPSSSPLSLKIRQEGAGAPWVSVRSRAAIPLRAPLSSGISVKKTWTAVERKDPKKWSRGDIVRVHLDLDSQSDFTWVVVSDPVPAGATILGGALKNSSQLLAAGEKPQSTPPTYIERSFEAMRAYYSQISKGKWSVEYTMRLNQSGVLQLPPTRAEVMYSPEVFGEIPNDAIRVEE